MSAVGVDCDNEFGMMVMMMISTYHAFVATS